MIGRLKFEIDPLVNEMLNKLPADVWTSDSTTFLDLAIGGGQFVKEIERRLREAGHSDENIASRVFGFEKDILAIRFAVNKYKLVGTYVADKNVLTRDFKGKQFDVVIGNPPYNQGDTAVNKTIYHLFSAMMIDISRRITIAITPGSFGDSVGKKFLPLISAITQANLQEVVFLPADTFGKKIDIHRPCYWWTDKSKPAKTSVEAAFATRSTELVSKIIDSANPKLKPIRGGSGYETDSFVKKTPSSTYRYKHITRLLQTGPEFYYIDSKHFNPRSTTDVALLFSERSGDLIANEYILKSAKEYSMTCNVVGFEVTSVQEAKELSKILKTPLYRFLIQHYKQNKVSPFKPGWMKLLPAIDLTRSWTDEELYKHFNLTQEEIEYIEANA